MAQQHAPASANWEALGQDGQAYYRKEEIYSMLWSNVDLSDFIVAAARFGGPVALMRDDTKPTIMGKQQIGKPKISIYSSAGALIQTIQWDASSRIVRFGFTLNESLIVLTQDGSYRLYPLSPSSTPTTSLGYTTHTLGSEAAETGVLDARIYETGMVALLGSLAFVELAGWNEADPTTGTSESRASRIIKLADADLNEQPASWDVVPPEESTSRTAEVYVVTRNTVLTVDAIECRDEHFTRGPFAGIAASPNGRFIALTTGPNAASPHQLCVVSSDFSRVLSEYDLVNEAEGAEPDQVVWCGNNSVVLAWNGIVVMVGPFGDTLRYFYTEAVCLVSEIDGTRIVSSDKCDFLQKVPDSSLAVFRPGSASAAAILYESADQFERRTAKADDSLRAIRADLTLAVDTCIDAAGRELDVYWQRRLLKAASFGKTFLDLYNPTDFVTMSQTLRVLNAARYYEVGIPITYEQLRQHGPARLLSRLTLRAQHLLSLRVAGFLGLSTAPVLRHWASAKVTAAKGAEADDAVCQLIVSRLSGQADVSCADIARTAWQTGQTVLATKLLDHEPRAAKQVPLLLSMKEDNLAVVKAIESGDPDLVYTVLAHLKRSHSLGNFFRFVDNKPDAAALLAVAARRDDRELLRDFYYQDDRRTESACLALEEALAIDDFADKMAKVRQGAKAFAEDKERVFEGRMVEEQLRLLAYQQTLEKEGDGRKLFVGLSINETIRLCVTSGWSKKADKARTEWKVPDKRFWLVKLKALIEVRDWEGLELFARSKKSPVGYEPFVEHLVATGNHRQALNFVPRCEQRHRVDLYVKCGEWLKAAQECRDRGDRGRLVELRQRVPNQLVGAQLDGMLEEMGGNNGY